MQFFEITQAYRQAGFTKKTVNLKKFLAVVDVRGGFSNS